MARTRKFKETINNENNNEIIEPIVTNTTEDITKSEIENVVGSVLDTSIENNDIKENNDEVVENKEIEKQNVAPQSLADFLF